ncbi:uncharacterized protein VICG_01611 [Vittaforma corneae ATCC 50505]|uniref:Uncharacterized protein n=1 Tax=Vittaforma corneae (strain ATCC 50505) TaxID=993615 RepID=L2GLI9_VITCO|nr:uncharacterized protein VICG_01611 [Vittaforma corneae ATCC 50505]ELA41370.1 hypothetical protein VICG_01611 [Vittaforma corneae ATCC 50505]
MGLFSKLWRFRTAPIKTTYDTYNREALQIITPNMFSGLRAEISKTVLPFCQISNIRTNSTNQTFLTLSSRNSVFQFSFDSNRNYQLKSSLLTGPLVSKFHSIISHKKEIFNQFEAVLNSRFYNVALKLISPTFDASNLVYIVTYFVSLGFLDCGFEVVGLSNELGISFSSRIEGKDSVYCANIQRFNTLALSFYHKVLEFLELGGEIKRSPSSLSYAAGMRIRNYRSDVRCSIDSSRNVYFDWSESLSENLRIEFSSSYDWEDFEYGIGLSYES